MTINPKPTLIPLHTIEPDFHDWIDWLQQEIKFTRHRFGNDPEALKYFPNDYYQNLEQWWDIPQNRTKNPIVLIANTNKILDGWHRTAISHKLQLHAVPVIYQVYPPPPPPPPPPPLFSIAQLFMYRISYAPNLSSNHALN